MVLSTNHLAFVKKKQTKKGGISGPFFFPSFSDHFLLASPCFLIDIGLSSSFTVEISSVGGS